MTAANILFYGRGTRRSKWVRRIGVLFVLCLVLGVLSLVSVQSRRVVLDEITGSLKRETVWFGAFRFSSAVTPTPLQTRLEKLGIAWTPVWRVRDYSDCNIFGTELEAANHISSTPFMSCGQSQAVAATIEDAKLPDLVHVLQTAPQDIDRVRAVNRLGDPEQAFGAGD